jgi:hypothetical protein
VVCWYGFGGSGVRVLPDDAPEIKATPGKSVEDMVSRSMKRADDMFEGECYEFLIKVGYLW